MQRGRASRREENDRVVFERLWRGTFQAVVAPERRARAASLEPEAPGLSPALAPALAPALRSLLAGLRPACCCRCSCSERHYNDNLQVCLSNDEERKSMRSVIRCAFVPYRFIRRL